MEFLHFAISISLLSSLAVVGESHNAHDKLLTGEDYWQDIWPNTPIPSALRELLKQSPSNVEIDDLPMAIEDTQYPKTVFFEHQLYPGKSLKVQFSKQPFAQPYGILLASKENKDVDREGYNLDELCMKKSPSKGEHKYCAKSLRTLIDFAISKLGKNIQVLSSSFVDKQEQYIVKGVENFGSRAVTCHRLNFHKVVFYCHEINATTAFNIQLVAGDGTMTHALAVCHADTTGMNPEMLSEAMKIDPENKSPVCHFLGNKAVMWVPSLVVDDAYHMAS